MTTSINALHLSRSALGLIEQLETKQATRIAAAVSEWNICVQQAGFTGTFDFPTTGYTRKAQVIADLKRCIEQLNEIRIDADRNTGRPVDEEGNDTREWSGNSIEAAHAEALDINRWIDDAHCVGGVAFEGAADSIIAVRERAHGEALEMNEEISLCREIESLTYEQAVAYSDQWDFYNSDPEAQALKIRFDHDTALTMNAEFDHESALKMNAYFDALRGRFDLFWSHSVAPFRDRVLSNHHENALHINALIDGLVNEIREAMAEAERDTDSDTHMIAISIEATGPALERADFNFAADAAARIAGVAP